MLPTTAQAFVRDTVSAFRQIPLHPSQWPGTVIEWKGSYYIDRFLAFGLGPACGAYGLFGDAFAETCRAEGIVPNGHWVDDNVFFRFKEVDLQWVNDQRREMRSKIISPAIHDHGRTYWLDDKGFKHAEDFSCDAKVLIGAEDGFNCGLADIDRLSCELGWPWAPEKDEPWSSTFTYGGLVYNIATREMALPEKKRLKYLAAVEEWRNKLDGTHTLREAQSLYGKLEHATVVQTQGKWRTKGLLDFIASAIRSSKSAYSHRHQGPRVKADLLWWRDALLLDNFWRSFDPAPPLDINCFCDGSTSFGVGLHINGRERCFPLLPEYAACSDIKTIEALALELALCTVVAMGIRNTGIKIHTDNTAVLGAFKKGRMAAAEPDEVLGRVAKVEEQYALRVHLLWVASAENKSDDPSRGITTPGVERLVPPERDPAWEKWFGQSWKFTPKAIVVKAHPNRPLDIPASKRFATWTPYHPPGKKLQPPAIRAVLLSAFADGTQKNYSTALSQWHNFCDKHNISEPDRGPARPDLVELWISNEAGEKSGGYLKDWLAAMKAWHTLNEIAWTIDEDRISLIRRGVKAVQPPSRPPRPAMTVDWLNKVIQVTNVNDPQELMTATIAACGLWGLFRLGELVVKAIKDFDPRLHVTRAHLVPKTTVVDGQQSLTITVNVPRTKTSSTGDPVVLTQQAPPSDPIGLLHLHLQRNPSPNPGNEPLFSYRQNGKLKILNRGAFERTLKVLAKKAKLENVFGHSMRIGGCTTLLLRGVAPDRVMMHGRWNSDSFKKYIRDHAEILAPFIANHIAVRQQLVEYVPDLANAINVPAQVPHQERANAAPPPPEARDARGDRQQAHGPATAATGSARASAAR
ncbi:hypothetical protein A4X13_0g7918 [Tilletia indica]|uniref:Tyr recombinase domain-containing protein n=1 Tax=Tilletia indica TaxID=43049 RepID=A0A8T8SI23_9BASI|nr:hypothetical protein A4X13_0g7918 [Tilletia indica]